MSEDTPTLHDIRESQRYHEGRDVERFTEVNNRLKSIQEMEMQNLKRDMTTIQKDVGELKEDVGQLKENVSNIKEDTSALKGDMGWIKKAVLAVLTGVGSLFLVLMGNLLLK